ncbi:glycerol-3-phosphate 1-O-acyltransferase PlsY [Alkaliphilus serpentinus]|uniref:glycerol-3-phosphate 1-O-acyltransferase PlsY n=1 Tax=Alkaliphilus serpentinus TaxID=1482731 RepID=UPI00186581F9|nr:glycerol-3-phosphate 1-O-acyltransferase PlsY [Alkaliphilus serpentinus]
MRDLMLILIAYFLGNFSTSFIVGKIYGRIDIRKHGSGNAGTTNVYRTLGAKAGALALIGDALKGVLAVYIGQRYGGTNLALLCGAAAIIGHNWPVILKFKGGKGIATSIGVVFMVQPLSATICIAFGLVILFKFKYVSLASVSAISILPIILYFYGRNYFIFGLVLAIMAVYRHRANIQRLLKGTENKITAGSKMKGGL